MEGGSGSGVGHEIISTPPPRGVKDSLAGHGPDAFPLEGGLRAHRQQGAGHHQGDARRETERNRLSQYQGRECYRNGQA